MSSAAPAADAPAPSLPTWKKVAFALALLLGLGGLALTRGAGTSAPAGGDPAGAARSGELGASSLSGGILLGDTPPAEEPSPWAPLFMKGGLSFAVAFAAGFALRTFLKGTLLVAGVVVLAIFGLQKAGIVGEIDWARAQGYWDSLTANIGQQFESFKTFVTGSLPSAGAGTAGLVAGFRK